MINGMGLKKPLAMPDKSVKKRRLIDWRWLVGITALPLVVIGLFLLLALIVAMPSLRYAPRYFTDDYRARYDAPSSVVIDLEHALRTDDRAAMAELEGLRRPTLFATRENMRVTILYDTENGYWNYLFFDTVSYERFAHHVEQVNGRWVVAPEDIVYYHKSGEWKQTFFPLAAIYWLVEIVSVLGVLSYRITHGWRQETLGW
jgi:hypothetical protein